MFTLYKELSEEEEKAHEAFLTEGLVDLADGDFTAIESSVPSSSTSTSELHDHEGHVMEEPSSPVQLTVPKLRLRRMKNASDDENESIQQEDSEDSEDSDDDYDELEKIIIIEDINEIDLVDVDLSDKENTRLI